MGKTLEELMAELEKQARERIKFSETDPAATAYEDSEKTVPEDSIVSEKPVSERGSGVYEKGQTILDTYIVGSDPIHGGMGSVWRVHHNGWNVDLAMKRPQAKLFQSDVQKENFIEECKAWIDLGLHPNIVSCYYVREIDGVPTIFSEWMENGSLEDHIRKGTLYTGSEQEQQERLLDIAIQFARGLHYAHEQGRIHQDVKPDNLLLTKDWDAKVADFGLAKARAQLTVLEGKNTVRDAGATVVTPSGGYTPAYCSMEQMDGKPLTRRTDIYSWAVSVLEMYLGDRPWMNGVVAGFSCGEYFEDCRVPMPGKLKGLLQKCMASLPEDRPHDLAEIETDLQSIYRNEIGSDYPRPVSSAAADTADSLNNRALSYLDMGMPDMAEALWEQALKKEPEHSSSVCNHSLFLWRRGRIDAKELNRRCESVFKKNTELEESLRPLLAAEEESTLPNCLYNASNSICTQKSDNAWRCVAVSPDGKMVFVLFDTLCCFDAHTAEKKYENPDVIPTGLKNPYPNCLLVTHDGKYLLFSVGYEPHIYVAEAATGRVLCVLRGHGKGSIIALCVHPYENLLYSSSEDKTLRRWNIETGECEQVYDVPFGKQQAVGWLTNICVSPKDHRLYASATANGIAVWDERSGAVLPHLLVERESPCGSLAVSPDGRTLYARGCVIRPSDGSFSENGALAETRCLWLSPDGKKLLVADIRRVITLWNPESWQLIRTFQADENDKWRLQNIECIAAAQDLSVIVSSNVNKCVLVYHPGDALRRVPWELSAIRSYREQMSRQREIETQRKAIEEQIIAGNLTQAVALLEQAEEHFSPHLFQPLRRKLSALCQRGRLKDVYEIVTFEAADYSGIPWESSQSPAADPRGGVYASTERGYGKNIYLFSEAGKRLGKLPSESEYGGLGRPTYSPDGKRMAVGSYDCVMIYDTEEMTLRHTIRTMPHAVDESTHPIDFSPDGQTLLVGAEGGYLALWDTETGELIREFVRGETGVWFVCFADEGRKAVAIDQSKCLNVFDTASGRQMKRKAFDSWISSACLSPNGSSLYLWLDWEDKLGIIDTKRWELCGELQPGLGGEVSLCFSPDGTVLATTGSGGLRLWELPGHKLLWELPELKGSYMTFSPDGCVLCVAIGIRVHMLMLRYELIPRE